MKYAVYIKLDWHFGWQLYRFFNSEKEANDEIAYFKANACKASIALLEKGNTLWPIKFYLFWPKTAKLLVKCRLDKC